MAAKTTPAAASALADAFAALSAEGKPVTVRSLRDRARVGTDAASEWLRTNRPTRDVPPVPAEELERVLEPLWSAAVAAARDEQAEADAGDRATLVAAEAAALTELTAAISRAEEAEDHAERLRREIADRDAQLADRDARLAAAEAARSAATKDAADARTTAHTAELAAAEAQATARTLREVLDSLSKGTKSERPRPKT